MSNWTHVAGTIRVDGHPWTEEQFKKVFGEPFESHHWDTTGLEKELAEHPERFMPTSSEGSPIEITRWSNDDPCCMEMYTFTLFADLRDYEDTQEITDYFIRVCNNIGGIAIRQVCLSSYNEFKEKTQVVTTIPYNLFDFKLAITTYEKGVITNTEYVELSEYSQVGLHDHIQEARNDKSVSDEKLTDLMTSSQEEIL